MKNLSSYETTAYLWRTTSRDSQVSEKTKVPVDRYYVQNGVAIRLNRSTQRKYKRTNKERTMVTEQTPHLVPHDNSWTFKRANLVVTRSNLQLQCYRNY